MRYVFITFGSRGDIQPTLAIAHALVIRGHDVQVVGPPNFCDIATHLAVPYFPAGDDMQMVLERERKHVHGSPRVLMREMKRVIGDQFARITAIVDPLVTPGAVVIASAVSLAAASFAYARNCKYFYIALQPVLFRKSGLPPAVFPQGLGFPGWINRAIGWGHDALWTQQLKSIFEPLHAYLNLPPLQDLWNHMLGTQPILACDPELVGPLDSRLPACQGSVFLGDDRPLPSELESFLADGFPPIYVGFGSMPDENAQESTRTILDVARAAGTRVVLSSGWAKLHAQNSSDVCVIGDVSHAALFSRTRAVIHHGGAGTTARVAFSGVPQLVMPHMLDQYYWGERVHALHVGPKPLPRSKLNTQTFARKLKELLHNKMYEVNAKRLASRMVPDGIDRIVRILENNSKHGNTEPRKAQKYFLSVLPRFF